MNLRLATDQDRDRWNKFVLASPQGSFMQSWPWGDMQSNFGLPIWRFIVEEGSHIQGVALVLGRQVSFGRSWLYLPHGPIFNGDPKIWRLLSDQLRQLGEQQRAIFIRSDPLLEQTNGQTITLIQSGWQKAEREIQPRHTLIIDLAPSATELLSQMHSKTRYNIRLAQRKKVMVRFSRQAQDMDAFLRLTQAVESRGLFRYHPVNYYRAMLDHLSPSQTIILAVAEHNHQILAVNILIGFGTTMTYTHGASSSNQRKLMAPHLLQWESINRAQRTGYQHYDFFGITAADSTINHPWAGITRFKLGFGGRRVNYIGAYDLVLDPVFYLIYNSARRLKGVIR